MKYFPAAYLPTYLGHTIFITFTWWPGCMVLARLQGIIIHLLSCDDILCHPVTLIKYYHWRLIFIQYSSVEAGRQCISRNS